MLSNNTNSNLNTSHIRIPRINVFLNENNATCCWLIYCVVIQVQVRSNIKWSVSKSVRNHHRAKFLDILILLFFYKKTHMSYKKILKWRCFPHLGTCFKDILGIKLFKRLLRSMWTCKTRHEQDITFYSGNFTKILEW